MIFSNRSISKYGASFIQIIQIVVFYFSVAEVSNKYPTANVFIMKKEKKSSAYLSYLQLQSMLTIKISIEYGKNKRTLSFGRLSHIAQY